LPLNSPSWISVEFKLYLIKEFQRLKVDENRRLSLAWNLNRTLSKLNYRIHTDAIKAHLIPAVVTPAQSAITYATEADVLNVALFGQTANRWRDASPKLAGAHEGRLRQRGTRVRAGQARTAIRFRHQEHGREGTEVKTGAGRPSVQ